MNAQAFPSPLHFDSFGFREQNLESGMPLEPPSFHQFQNPDALSSLQPATSQSFSQSLMDYQTRRAAELNDRIAVWRLDVYASISDPSSSPSPPPPIAPSSSTSSAEHHDSFFVSQKRTSRRQSKPYMRRDTSSPLNQQPSPSEYRRSCRTPSLVDSKLGGIDLPHSTFNPLITRLPEDVQELYCRITVLYNKLIVQQNHLAYQCLHIPASLQPPDATEFHIRLVEVKANAQRCMEALNYIIEYSRVEGWDIDFQQTLNYWHDRSAPSLRTVPSQMREMVCYPMFPSDPSKFQPAV